MYVELYSDATDVTADAPYLLAVTWLSDVVAGLPNDADNIAPLTDAGADFPIESDTTWLGTLADVVAYLPNNADK